MQELSLAGLNVLVVEDELLLRKQITAHLERLGADVTTANTVAAARRLAAELEFDFVFLDINLPDGLGTDLLKNKTFSKNTGVIVMTAQVDVNVAVQIMKLGVLDYLQKPVNPAELAVLITRARRARQSARIEEQTREDTTRTSGVFFFGAALAPIERQLQKILETDARLVDALPPVLIQGETGTGKTTIARMLHHRGPRASQPMVEINCSALPESLAESELFGHERGAFTDAKSGRMGLFEAANGGTLFLDELPSLSLPLQAKVLTAIEDLKIRRVGGSKPISIDVRLIAAANCSLPKLIAEGKFREDLYHRLDLFRVNLPALRERGQDIIKLAQAILSQLYRRHRLPEKPISDAGIQRLLAYPWPGNVRELAHELERSLVFEDGETLSFTHLTPCSTPAAGPQQNSPGEWLNPAFTFPATGFSLEQAINRLIQNALKQANGNVSAAARLLGVSRDYVRYRLEGQPSTEGKPPTRAE